MPLRRSAAFAVLLALVALAAVPLAAADDERAGGKWELLGVRQVSDKVDRDVIAVTAKEGRFTKLQVRVKLAPVQFRSMKVHFANGETQDVELKDVIRPNQASRVIDLPGVARVISKVEFVYDAQTLGKKGAMVRLFGRH